MSVFFPKLQKIGQIRYGFSDRRDGSMHRHLKKESRSAYFRKIGIDPSRVVAADLNHGTNVFVAEENSGGKMIGETDALITKEKNLYLSITTADCYPVYFHDPVQKCIGITHAGWRGVLGGIIPETVRAMTKNFGTDPADVLVGLGPAIRKCHFEISPDDEKRYQGYSEFVSKREGKVYVDLAGIIKAQFLQSGGREENIEDCDICTYCNKEEYFSYRRDKPQEIQPMIGYIGIFEE